MMENEVLIKTPGEAIETIKFNMPTSGYQMLREALDMAISALKEIQQYREIGTVEECKELASMFTTEKENVLGQIVDEWKEYIKIGTVEECREAVEKQKAKEIVCENDSVFSNGFSHYRIGRCPMCDRYYNSNDAVNYCSNCGQAIQWDENLEGMEE